MTRRMTRGKYRDDPQDDPKGRFRKGKRGERIAAFLLMCKGYRILSRRLRSEWGLGEVDLLVQRGRTLVVVEVKWRSDRESVAYALQARQRDRLRRAGEVLFARLARTGGVETLRFDVVLLTPFSIRHLTNAF